MIQTSGSLVFCDGYDYRVENECWVNTPITDEPWRIMSGGRLLAWRDSAGRVYLLPGYSWNGVGGNQWRDIVPDINMMMRASAFHDAGYQAIGEGGEPSFRREWWDHFFADLCVQDGLPSLLRQTVYEAVHIFGASHAARHSRAVLVAP